MLRHGATEYQVPFPLRITGVRSAWRYLALFAVMGVLHQDVWFWDDGRLVLGVLPVGLAYHVAYTVLAAIVLAWLVRHDWPRDLEGA